MTDMNQDPGLTIAGKTYHSRLLVGSGKYKDLDETRLATEASGADIITVAIRRVNIGQPVVAHHSRDAASAAIEKVAAAISADKLERASRSLKLNL